MALAVRRFTVEEFLRMEEVGILREDDRVELLDGRIVVMTPIGAHHAACVDRLTRRFSQLVGERAIVRVQNPVVLDAYGLPQPDLALLPPPIERYADAHPAPQNTLLVIEVADTSGPYDRGTKMPAYARAGIPEAWLVSLPERTIETYGDPGLEGYRTFRRAGPAETLRLVMLPDLEIAVADILG